MKDVKNAKFIESVINQNDLRAFVCSNRDDLRLFLDEVQYRHKMKFNFEIVNLYGSPLESKNDSVQVTLRN